MLVAVVNREQFVSVIGYFMTLSETLLHQMTDKCRELGGNITSRGTKVCGGKPPQCCSVHHKSHMTLSGTAPMLPMRKLATKCLSHGTAQL
jgi:hypothetical protein